MKTPPLQIIQAREEKLNECLFEDNGIVVTQRLNGGTFAPTRYGQDAIDEIRIFSLETSKEIIRGCIEMAEKEKFLGSPLGKKEEIYNQALSDLISQLTSELNNLEK